MKESEESAQPIPEKKTAPKDSRDPRLVLMIKVGAQADQVLREAWWVVAGERRPAPKSAFGKVQRAAQWVADGKLANKGVFQCDRYLMKPDGGNVPGALWRAEFFEKCGEKQAEKHVFTWSLLTDRSADVEFTPQSLGEVLGIGASIFGKKLRCRLEWNEDGVLDLLSCPNWEQDRKAQLIRLEIFEYKRDAGALMKLRGKVLQDLNPVRKIEADVPLAGKIVVTETELNAPESAPPPKAAIKKPPPPKGSNSPDSVGGEGAPNQPEHVDPDLLQGAPSNVRRGAPMAPPPAPAPPVEEGREAPENGASVDEGEHSAVPEAVRAEAEQAQPVGDGDLIQPPEGQRQEPVVNPIPESLRANQDDMSGDDAQDGAPALTPTPQAEPEYIPATPIPATDGGR